MSNVIQFPKAPTRIVEDVPDPVYIMMPQPEPIPSGIKVGVFLMNVLWGAMATAVIASIFL